jgi:hypothetical protein
MDDAVSLASFGASNGLSRGMLAHGTAQFVWPISLNQALR